MTFNVNRVAQDILIEISREARDIWNNPDALFFLYRGLSIDKRGSFGERVFSKLLHESFSRRISLEYKDGDQGDWDIKINGFKFEVKTSSLDVNRKFQNEGLKIDGDYDGIFFLGVSPNILYFKIVRKSDIPWQQLHNRGDRGTGRGHKWDFKLNDLMALQSIDVFKDEFVRIFPNILNR